MKQARYGSGLAGVGDGDTGLADVLAWMDDDAPVTLTFTAGALRRAVTMAAGGPEVMSTSQAAQIFGFSTKRWRGWAEADRVVGAWRDERGNWRLPRPSCAALMAEREHSGSPPGKPQRVPVPEIRARLAKPIRTRSEPTIRRGPRKTPNE